MEPFSIASFKFYSIAVIIISGGKSSVLLDVKPWDDETDMKKLEEAVRSVQMPGLLWGACTVDLHNLHICLLCLIYLFIYLYFLFLSLLRRSLVIEIVLQRNLLLLVMA